MTEVKAENKRKDVRHRSDDILYISSKEGTFKGKAIDISVSGIRFYAEHKFSTGYIVDLSINYNPINFLQKAFVRWTSKVENEYEYGAEFINVNAINKLLLEDHIQNIIRKTLVSSEE